MVSVTEAVRDAVGAVADPELPVVTLAMLGMVHDVEVADGHTTIELLPTFAGCPATDVIGEDARAAALAVEGVDEATVRFRFSPAWTPTRISAEGHERLREFGIAPPTGGLGAKPPAWPGAGPVSDVQPTGRGRLPVVAATPGVGKDPRACPYCGSADTARDSAFGPTPCRDLRFCETCRQPFEGFKS